MPNVVIIGGGFGGLAAARILADHKNIHVTLLDERNHHLFQPLLYQVAMAGLSPAEIAYPIRSILLRHHPNCEVLMGRAETIDLKNQRVASSVKTLNYDYLILACGATHSYFGHDNWEQFAPGLKTIEQATEIRRRVLLAFEMAECASASEEQRELLTFIVVGGGPTGVELAGALGEISRYTLSRDFSHIDPRRTRIILIEGGPRLLASFDEKLSGRAARDLEKIGVTVWTSTVVTAVDQDGVTLQGGEVVKARTILWAAGVKPSPLNQTLNVPLDRQGRVIVEADLTLKDYPNVAVIGDQASFALEGGRTLPGLASVAMQEGRHAAKNILRQVKQNATKPFVYRDKGQMATIGRRRAVLQIGKFRLGGILAWFAWLLVHIYYLIGFKNRIFVLMQWAWSYFFFRRGARLIVNKEWRSTETLKASPAKSSQSQPR